MSQSTVAAVVTYNRATLLQECLDSCLGQKEAFVEKILVFNNASTDNTSQVLLDYKTRHPDRIEIINSKVNLGGAAGFSKVIEAASKLGPRWIWIMDDDAIPYPDALAQLLASEPAKLEKIGALGCLVLREDEGLFLPNLQCKVDRENFSFIPVSPSAGPVQVDTNSFVGMLLRADRIKQAGLPRADYFIWFDDIEYSLRLSSKFEVWLIPAAKIAHKAKPNDLERNHRFFRAKFADYPWSDCWRLYYGNRNRWITAKPLMSLWAFHKAFVKQTSRDLLIPVLAGQDHKLKRMTLVLQAAWDGYFGRTPARYKP